MREIAFVGQFHRFPRHISERPDDHKVKHPSEPGNERNCGSMIVIPFGKCAIVAELSI